MMDMGLIFKVLKLYVNLGVKLGLEPKKNLKIDEFDLTDLIWFLTVVWWMYSFSFILYFIYNICILTILERFEKIKFRDD